MGEGLKRAFAACRSTRLPPKQKRPKMGIREAAQKVWSRHRRFVKSHGCCVPNCEHRGDPDMPIDFAHVKTRGAGGQDWQAISLCRVHHSEQHTMTIAEFGQKYGIDLWALAMEFTRKSPDKAMRECLALVGTEELQT